MSNLKRLMAAAGFTLAAASPIFAQTVSLTVPPGDPKLQISKHIYGHFAEHLGRCVYDGFWVDEKLNVPKQGRIRLDIVEALRKIKVPNLR